MADFSNIIQETNRVIYDNESGGITSSALRLLILGIIDEINDKKADKSSPTPPSTTEYGIPDITYCKYTGIEPIPASSTTLGVNSFDVHFTQTYTIDGVEQDDITSGGTVEISLNKNSGYGNSVLIPQNTESGLVARNIYVKVSSHGKKSEATTVTITQDAAQIDLFLYAEILLSQGDAERIRNNQDTIENHINNISPSDIKYERNGYYLDDSDSTTHFDEYDVTTALSGIFISVFLLSNTLHRVVELDDETQVEIESWGGVSKYQSNNFTYNGNIYKCLAVLKVTNSPLELKIQIKK